MKSRLVQILVSFFVGIILGVISLFYYQKNTSNNYVHIRNFADSVFSLQSNILSKGDTNSYNKLYVTFRDNNTYSMLFWSMLMANKYDYPKAYEDVYYSIEESYSPDSAIFKMDEKTRTFALHYLKLAAQKNDTSALDKIKELKAMNIPPSWLK